MHLTSFALISFFPSFPCSPAATAFALGPTAAPASHPEVLLRGAHTAELACECARARRLLLLWVSSDFALSPSFLPFSLMQFMHHWEELPVLPTDCLAELRAEGDKHLCWDPRKVA